MANWTGVITNAGNNVLLEWINEKTLHFDSAAAGQGTVETVGMLAQMALVNQKQVTNIIGAERVSMGIRLKIRITAPQAAYMLNQYGVWASITGGSTTMIALFHHEKGIPIPSAAESPNFVYTFYALISTSNTGKWTVNIDTSASVTLEEMNAAIATAVATKEGVIKDASEKDSLADADCIAVVDSADGGKTKRVLWSTVKAALAKLFVPLTRKINGKVLSSDVTITGEDVKVSGSDETSISSSLSNKLSITDHGSNNISLFDAALSDGIHICSNWTNCPPGLTDTQGICMVLTFMNWVESEKCWGYRIYLPINDQKIYINRCANSVWDGWETIAIATPPREYALPLQNGWTALEGHRNGYSVDQFGFVRGWFGLTRDTIPSNNTVVCLLPEGARPSSHCSAAATLWTGGVVYPANMLTLNSGEGY